MEYILLANSLVTAFNAVMEVIKARQQQGESTPEEDAAMENLVKTQLALSHWTQKSGR